MSFWPDVKTECCLAAFFRRGGEKEGYISCLLGLDLLEGISKIIKDPQPRPDQIQ